jgi:hypothetical protein
MPFSPLPKTLLEDLHQRRQGCVVEVGCGDGGLSRLLEAEGARPWRVDRRHPDTGSVADLVADVCDLPLIPRRVDLLVAGNLLRHLWPLGGAAAVPGDWQDCLAPGGCLYILEDEPVAQPAAARNYRRLQDFLARLLPETRRPLLSRSTFLAALTAVGSEVGEWSLGVETNHWPADPQAALSMLRGESVPGRSADLPDATPAAGGRLRGEAQRLVEAIEKHGLSYGPYWWARWRPEVTG